MLRRPYYARNKYRVDADAFLTRVRCCNNHRWKRDDVKDDLDAPGPGEEMGDEWVRDLSGELSAREFSEAEAWVLAALKLEHARLRWDGEALSSNPHYWTKKPIMETGDKYKPRDPSVDSLPHVWLVLDSHEHRLQKALGHLPYVLVATLPIGDAWIVCEDGRASRPKERKTIADLHQSTLSGHKQRQVANILLSGILPSQFEWWIEDPTPCIQCSECSGRNDEYVGYDAETRAGMANLKCRDGMSVCETRGLFDTLARLLRELQSVVQHGLPVDGSVALPRFGLKSESASENSTQPSDGKSETECPVFTPDTIQSQVEDLLSWIKACRGEDWRASSETRARAAAAAAVQTHASTCLRPSDFRDDRELALALMIRHGCNRVGNAASDIARQYGSMRALQDAYRQLDQEANGEPKPEFRRLRRMVDAAEEEAEKGTPPEEGEPQTSLPETKKKNRKRTGTDAEPQPSEEKKKRKDRKRTEPDRIEKLAFMLQDISRGDGQRSKRVGPGVSRTIWLQTYATEEDSVAWLQHPKNRFDKARQKRQAGSKNLI